MSIDISHIKFVLYNCRGAVFLALLGICFHQNALGQSALFDAEELITLTIETNMQALLADRGDERGEHAASISYQSTDDITVSQAIKIKVRGNFRRDPSNCSFPPLRLNFNSEQSAGTLFKDQDKLKLVNPCQINSKLFTRYLLLEYAAYKLLNMFTEASFRVRLFPINFVDTSGKRSTITSYGFLIEDELELANRLGGEVLEKRGLQQPATDQHQMTIVALFQYLIGNTDWFVAPLHNIRLVSLPHSDKPLAIPYDFDHSGLVNARYAKPNYDLPIKFVKQRYFKGLCQSPDALAPYLAMFKEKQPAIDGLWEEIGLIKGRALKNTRKFIDGFYKTIQDEEKLKRAIEQSCM